MPECVNNCVPKNEELDKDDKPLVKKADRHTRRQVRNMQSQSKTLG